MSTDVTVIIKSKITSEGETEEITETVQGTYFDKSDYGYVVADTYENNGKSTLRLKIGRDSLEMKRSGASNATMQFQKGAVREAVYNTPYGNLCFEIETQDLNIYRDREIRILLKYRLKSNSEIVSGHELNISIM